MSSELPGHSWVGRVTSLEHLVVPSRYDLFHFPLDILDQSHGVDALFVDEVVLDATQPLDYPDKLVGEIQFVVVGDLLVDQGVELVDHLLLVEELVDRVEGLFQR